MKIVGLIAEYNPFHNGHKYHIDKAKEISGADYCVVVMSGDFVQRGYPAFLPKHLRTLMALSAGADLVLEIPSCYACGSAEFFAKGAVALLENLGCIDSLCFGSECGDYQLLKKIAQIVSEEPDSYKKMLQSNLKCGLSFPAARQEALKTYFNEPIISQALDEPNNILGIEYIKALFQSNSSIKGYTLQRKSSAYHDKTLVDKYSSASAIRNIYADTNIEPDFSKLKEQVPIEVLKLLKDHYQKRYPVYANDFSLLLKYKLLSESKSSLTAYQDISQELANRIINHLNEFHDFEQFCDLLKTKDMTFSRISRSLLHILLNIRSQDLDMYEKSGNCLYARVLGFRKSSAELFSILKTSSHVPILTKLTHTDSLSSIGIHMIEHDIFCSNLYESIISDKFKNNFINEYHKQIVRI